MQISFTFTFSALNLEKEYSREKAAAEKPRKDEREEYEEMEEEDEEEVTEDEYEERSGWDFFKSVIRTNLGPEVIEPDIPAESATKRSRPKIVKTGKKRKNRGKASNGKAEKGHETEVNSTKLGKEEEGGGGAGEGGEGEEDMETTTLPPCSLVLPIDIERGFKCYNDTEVWTRYKIFYTVEAFLQWSCGASTNCAS